MSKQKWVLLRRGNLPSSPLSSLLALISQMRHSGGVPEKVGTFIPGVQPQVSGGGGPTAGCKPRLDGSVSCSGCIPGFCQPPVGGQGLLLPLCASASRLIQGHNAQCGYSGSFDAWSQGRPSRAPIQRYHKSFAERPMREAKRAVLLKTFLGWVSKNSSIHSLLKYISLF